MVSIGEFGSKIKENISRVIVGKEKTIERVLAVLISGGHVLINDVPGVGKTMLARSLAISLGLEFNRLQCTPDLLPGDVTGISILNLKTNEFNFRKGPIFTQILLVDEINRTTPRTQSALLEAMAERQVTVDGRSFQMEKPFFVIATQNPVEFEGTFPLPEAQLDRFSISLTMGYPDEQSERKLLKGISDEHPITSLKPVSGQDELDSVLKQVKEVEIEDSVLQYIISIVNETRSHRDIQLGVSPRGSIALMETARALAGIRGRRFVIPDDVKETACDILSHRIIIKPEARLMRRTNRDVINEIVESLPIPINNEKT
ncbi:magnesium chelatase [Mesotoga sp. HF07.pep.5.2.highcov]|jgi:MoxR-like ATPase|uniref:MoxR-like ATPase n=1 Tax=Mesotoga prima MesG1.Ag.4.2 TaxID=660470 RepID=I2F8B2_9BACT|nr:MULTISPECIES: MoxR family ATPase [Mesotoga]AFK08165.1 MoxR-like ATPase [Mesotoga prima MesG1.Ag.4.2]PIJ61433.1 magnesium chelatase [Mesotoga sp. H07.pep.5.3]RLL91669.1 magnesium chelatase [Mesotoga sp. HF07.pep.5.2.highcov]HOZ99974.1 MoxR family ATPase [Mesotoga prima]HQN61428.1 MoxR family ATPase [Mesotoga prima]